MSYLKYWDVSNLYVWSMSLKFSENSFIWVKIFPVLMKACYKAIMKKLIKDIFLKLVLNILQSLHNDDFFTWKNENWNWKNQKSVHNVHNEIEFAVHIRNLKQALNHELVLKKVLKVINFNQKAWLRPCIEKIKKRFRSRLYQIDQ